MPIRQAQASDLEAAAKVCAAGFYEDNLFGDIIHPFRHEYPDDMHLYWLKRFRKDFGRDDNHFIVATAPGANGSEGDAGVVGLAHWTRIRPGQDHDDSKDAEPKELGVELPPNRAADPAQEDVIERCYSFLQHQWTGPRAESWYLACLAVDPKYHGQGHGRQLVAYGFEQAEGENVCVSVISAHGKDGFYQRCGFTTQSGNAGDGEGNPIKGVDGGNVWFRDV